MNKCWHQINKNRGGQWLEKNSIEKTASLLSLLIIIRALNFCMAVVIISAAAGCIGESSGITNTENYLNETPDAKRAVIGYVSRKTGINVSDGEIIFGFDDHGGFHGDGELYLEIQTPYSLDNELIGNPLWKSAPIPEKIKNIIEPVTKYSFALYDPQTKIIYFLKYDS